MRDQNTQNHLANSLKKTPTTAAPLSRRDAILAGAAGLSLALPNAPVHASEQEREVSNGPYNNSEPLKIEAIEAFWLYKDTDTERRFPKVFVRVYTDQGVIGQSYIGVWHSWDRVLELIRDGIAPLLIGMDAMQIERCWQTMWKLLDTQFARGVGNSILPMFTRAMAAVDSALWDTVGKALSAPLYQMWGAYTNEVPAISFDQRYRHPGENYDPIKFGRHMEKLIEMGFGGVKLKPGRPPFTPKQDAEWVRIVRDALGPDFLIQADANLLWSVEEAIEFCREVEDLNLRWIEEPCRTRREIARVRAATGIPVCAGQSELTIDGARYLMTENAIDVCNYDPSYGGGPTAWRKVYGLAAAFGVEMSVHQQPQTAAHLMASTPHGEKHGVEFYMPDVDPWFYEMITNQNPIKNGVYRVLDGPGFGCEYDEKFIATHRYD